MYHSFVSPSKRQLHHCANTSTNLKLDKRAKWWPIKFSPSNVPSKHQEALNENIDPLHFLCHVIISFVKMHLTSLRNIPASLCSSFLLGKICYVGFRRNPRHPRKRLGGHLLFLILQQNRSPYGIAWCSTNQGSHSRNVVYKIYDFLPAQILRPQMSSQHNRVKFNETNDVLPVSPPLLNQSIWQSATEKAGIPISKVQYSTPRSNIVVIFFIFASSICKYQYRLVWISGAKKLWPYTHPQLSARLHSC